MKLILALILISSSVYCQNLTDREIQKIENFGISLDKLNLENEKTVGDLNFILKKNKKRKRKMIIGTVLGSLSILSIIGGIIIQSPSDKWASDGSNYTGNAYPGIIGGFFIGTGVIEGGISILLFSSSKRKKNQRDKIIRIYNEEWNK